MEHGGSAGQESVGRSRIRSVSSPARAWPDASDADLAAAIADGAGPRAEGELMARFRPRVLLYGRRHLRDAARAEDLAQEVMTKVLVRLRAGEVRETSKIGSFVLGTARNTAREMRRNAGRFAELTAAVERERASCVEPPARTDTTRLASALAELPERERSVLLLSFAEGLSAGEIGDTYSLKPGHVRVIRHRAIARLGDLLRVDELSEGGDR